MSNIIRNAFVHTNHGLVIINQSGHEVTITNVDTAPIYESNELGFELGLGLELTHRLTSQYSWYYSSKETSSGRHVY
ncbi:hypothetical protein [Pseudoalteromonas holothuriae]|uniref:hypothetical protein n=1 Tax=Pseudoalteromonas holothuriae TaxID=2963714 RepID=UPI0021C1A90E|nr:hypothetical protein [Pseudoalteromonas sp. CIP111951]